MGAPELIGTILLSGTFGAIAKDLVTNFLQRRKLGADTDKVEVDAADVVTKTALALVEPLGTRIRQLEGEVQQLRAQVNATSEKARQTAEELDECRASGRAKDRHIREQDAELERLRREGRI